MSGELKHHIKTESMDSIPLYKRPLPFELEPIPPVDPNRKMTLEQFTQLQKLGHGFQKVGCDKELRHICLAEIESRPDMWSCRNMRKQKVHSYPLVAVEVYKRTGVLVTSTSVQAMFKQVKDGLRLRLRNAIVDRKLGPVETEERLLKWPLYGHCRFFRAATATLEEKFRKEAGRNPVCYVLEDDVDDDVTLESDGEEESAIEVQEEPYEDADIVVEEVASTSTPYYPNFHQSTPLMKANLVHYPYSAPVKMPSPKPSFEVDFREEMSQITYQAARISREQPESVKLLRKALFDTVLAFDDKNYSSVGELFRDLADRHSR